MDPLKFANKICNYAGIDPEVNEKSIKLWAKRVQNTNNNEFVEAITSRAYSTDDHRVRVDRWKENMTKEEVEQVVSIIKETAGNFILI